ncbi:aldo/keto reductase family protein [Ceratobasidium sp. AG-Ba]|nr:aldo/keto reductase family protein [Ceratobasidium sp. AG-Ba]
MTTPAPPTRKIGNNDLSAIGFGNMGLSRLAYGAAGDDKTQFKVLDKLQVVENFARVLEVIFVGRAEELIGKRSKRTGKRDQETDASSWIFQATKLAFLNFGVTEVMAKGDPNGVRGDPE